MTSDDPHDDHHPAALVCIARMLDVPVATFFTAGPAETPNVETTVAMMDDPARVAELLRVFARLDSPEDRARCLAYVVQEATRGG